MAHSDFSPEEIRCGRETAAAMLVAEICLCGEGVASFLGVGELFARFAIPRLIAFVSIFLYYYVIKKPRLVDTPRWYVLLGKDKVIRGFWVAAMLVLAMSIGA